MRLLLCAAVLAACFCGTGCVTSKVVQDSRKPELVIDESGAVSFNNEPVKLGKIASALKSAGIARTQEINVQIPEHPDRSVMQKVSGELVHGGYSRTVFIKKRKATAELIAPKTP